MVASASLVRYVSRVCVSARRECAKALCASICVRCTAGHTESQRTPITKKPVALNLLDRRFIGWSPNQAWTGDITYLLTDEGWLYLAAIVDLGTRRIVGWAMSERMTAKLVCDALQMAYRRRRPAPGLLLHSDRGSQPANLRDGYFRRQAGGLSHGHAACIPFRRACLVHHATGSRKLDVGVWVSIPSIVVSDSRPSWTVPRSRRRPPPILLRCPRWVDSTTVFQSSARASAPRFGSDRGPFRGRDSRNDSPLVFSSIRWL